MQAEKGRQRGGGARQHQRQAARCREQEESDEAAVHRTLRRVLMQRVPAQVEAKQAERADHQRRATGNAEELRQAPEVVRRRPPERVVIQRRDARRGEARTGSRKT